MSQRRHEEPTKKEQRRETVKHQAYNLSPLLVEYKGKEMLEDIAILTGGTVITCAEACLHYGRQPQHKLEDADLSMLGQSEKISIDCYGCEHR